MHDVRVERSFEHPIDAVFDRYTDHVGWSEWAGVGQVRLAREGTPERDGVGCVRAFAVPASLQEEVTAFERPRRMEYRVIRGAFPMTDHRGEVLFAPEGAGTRVTWRVSFRWRLPGTGWLVDRALAAFFRRVLDALARDLDRRAR
jgi:uncharacterized protein YndB with AHSA1/START domain